MSNLGIIGLEGGQTHVSCCIFWNIGNTLGIAYIAPVPSKFSFVINVDTPNDA